MPLSASEVWPVSSHKRLALLVTVATLSMTLWSAAGEAQFIYPYPYRLSLVQSRNSVRIQAEPKTAEVYVDGFYAGIVDDFDGVFSGCVRRTASPRCIWTVSPVTQRVSSPTRR